jgi:hypothetical protein
MKKTQEILNIAERMSELYVTYRQVWIQQKADGTYHTEKKYRLHDDRIKEHLLQARTVGLTVDKVTKFVTFDIDYGKTSMSMAGQAVKALVAELTENHGIGLENILVSFSGSKGYHLEVFFNTPVYVTKARKWHNMVVQAIGGDINKIEFRPSHQGVKLPLGLHKVTGKKCHIVHPLTLTEMPDRHIFNIVQLDAERWYTMVDEMIADYTPPTIQIGEKKAKEFVQLTDITKMEIPVDYEERCQLMLEQNQLLYAGSRNSSSVLLIAYLSQHLGYGKDDVITIVKNIIGNTYDSAPHLLSGDTSKEKAFAEIEAIYSYACNYTLGGANRTVRLYEDEIEKVLEPKKMNLKQLLFILLLHSKKYAKKEGVFFMTYKQMADYGADKNGARLLQNLLKLEELGYIEIVQRNTRRKNGVEHLPNRYRVNITAQSERFIEFDTKAEEEIKFENVVTHLLTADKVKTLVSSDQFYKSFKPAYKAC